MATLIPQQEEAKQREAELAESEAMLNAEVESQEYERQETMMWTPGRILVKSIRGSFEAAWMVVDRHACTMTWCVCSSVNYQLF